MPIQSPRSIRAEAPPEGRPLLLQGRLVLAESSDGAKLPTLEMEAYTGGAIMQPWSYRPVVVDLAGVTAAGDAIPFLLDHDPTAIVGHGSVKLSASKIKASGVVSGAGEAAQNFVAAAKNGFPWQASIGGAIGREEFVEAGASVKVNGKKFDGPLLVVRALELREISVLALGADAKTSVRVAAGHPQGGAEMGFETWLKANGWDVATLSAEQRKVLEAAWKAETQPDQVVAEPKGDEPPPAGVAVQASGGESLVERMRREAADEEDRVVKIRAACKVGRVEFPEISAQAIREGWTVERTRCEVLEARLNAPTPTVPSSGGDAIDGKVIEAALCLQRRQPDVEKQYKPEVLEAADRQYRHLKLGELIMLAAAENGYPARPGQRISRGNIVDVLAHAFPPRMVTAAASTLSLPGILSNVANKELLVGYTQEEQTWREVSAVKSVSDFKSVTSYRMLDDMEYEELPKHGEIKQGAVGEETYTRQVKTYAKMFALDRQDIINDDLGAFDDLRTRVGGGAAKKLNDVFWTAFLANSSFFTAGRGNYVTGADSVLDVNGTGLQKAITAFRKLKSPSADGAKLVGGRPEILLVPPELEFIAQRLYQSLNVNTGGASTNDTVGNANIHSGKYRPVVSNWLSDASISGYSATAWYLLRSPMSLPAAIVSFLDGVEAPTVEMSESEFSTLGIQFRGYHDFGVDLAEYLAGVKSKGAA